MAKRAKTRASAKKSVVAKALTKHGELVISVPDVLPDYGQKAELTPAQVQPVQAPHFSASTVQVQLTGNEFIMTFARMAPAFRVDGTANEPNEALAMGQPVAIMSMSPQSAKDLSLLLAQTVAKHESDFGEIHTPFTKRREAAAERKKRAH